MEAGEGVTEAVLDGYGESGFGVDPGVPPALLPEEGVGAPFAGGGGDAAPSEVPGALGAEAWGAAPPAPAPALANAASEGGIVDLHAVWGTTDRKEIARLINSSGQRELQAKFFAIYNKTTTSNNNIWLKRKLLEAAGLQATRDGTPAVQAWPSAGVPVTGASAGVAPTLGSGPVALPTPPPPPPPPQQQQQQQLQAGGVPGPADGRLGSPGDDVVAVRKSNRPLKPKMMDDESPPVPPAGKAAVGRRVAVFWPDEKEWFSGMVASFDSKSGRHRVVYDDGDEEMLVLSGERLRWDVPVADGSAPRRPAVPAAGAAQPLQWPVVNDHVWGRVKGHGYWPGQVKSAPAGEPNVHVRFFDTQEAWVARPDLLPFEENWDSMRESKKTQTFLDAVTAARKSYDQQLRRRRAKAEKIASTGRVAAGGSTSARPVQGGAANGAAGGVGNGGNKRRRGAMTGAELGYVQGAPLLSQAGELDSRLDGVEARAVPLAERAVDHVKAQLQEFARSGGPPVCFAPETEAQERRRLLEQIAVLDRILALVPKHRAAAAAAAGGGAEPAVGAHE